MRDRINMSPVYQRQGDIWNLEKRQLLIDTIINRFDVPKLYVHKFVPPLAEKEKSYDYAMIDGKQRVKAILDFIDNLYPLDDKFRYLRDSNIDIGGLTYHELSAKHPDIKADFDSYSLDVVTIEAKDTEIIEDLFSRLNEAVPLNAAEKRNARPGLLPPLVRQLARQKFFSQLLPFGNSRYRHYDILAKMLLLASGSSVVDTKKAYLDRFFEKHAGSSQRDVMAIGTKVRRILRAMESVFVEKDPLLRSVGMISLYFLLFERAIRTKQQDRLARSIFGKFERDRKKNREMAEEDIAEASYGLLEFDRFAQSPNDGVALRYRLAVADDYLFNRELGFADDGVLIDNS